MSAAPLWEHIAGWVILCLAFFVLAAIILLPLQLVLRRLWPGFRPHWLARLVMTAVVAAAIWYATPALLHLLYYHTISS
jgi:uncharacterized membrane protein YhaH (DUF805 family)